MILYYFITNDKVAAGYGRFPGNGPSGMTLPQQAVVGNITAVHGGFTAVHGGFTAALCSHASLTPRLTILFVKVCTQHFGELHGPRGFKMAGQLTIFCWLCTAVVNSGQMQG